MLLVTRERNVVNSLVFYYAGDQSPEGFKKMQVRQKANMVAVSSDLQQLTKEKPNYDDIYWFNISEAALRPATPDDLSAHYHKMLTRIDTTLKEYSTLLHNPPNLV